jgi:hypothetical protein
MVLNQFVRRILTQGVAGVNASTRREQVPGHLLTPRARDTPLTAGFSSASGAEPDCRSGSGQR